MNTANIINLAKSASSLLLNQKNVAFFEEANYQEGNSLLGALGIDTNTVAGGLFSGDVKEVLIGGKTGLSDLVDAGVSFVFGNSVATADGITDSEIFKHPLEWNISGAKDTENARNYISDHSILKPEIFNCVMYLPAFFYTSVMQEVAELMQKKTLLRIVTRGKDYKYMVLRRYGHPMSPDRLHRMPIPLFFEQIQILYPKQSVALNETDAGGGEVPQ